MNITKKDANGRERYGEALALLRKHGLFSYKDPIKGGASLKVDDLNMTKAVARKLDNLADRSRTFRSQSINPSMLGLSGRNFDAGGRSKNNVTRWYFLF